MQLRSLTLPVPQTTWIPREQHRLVANMLMEYKLCKMDNTRQLPLTGGGKTDLYVDVRPSRSNPKAALELASLYAAPLRWLGVERIVEVPEAISGIAQLVSVLTGTPYATIRKDPKENRSRIIGELREGENVAIIDDVISDGGSKLQALELCRQLKLNLRALVVLVDRQQGWQAKLSNAGFDTPVWAGMTLHDFRREVIAAGAMERCDPEIEKKNPIIVALDGKPLSEALAIADALRTTGCIYKVNDLIKAVGAHRLLPELHTYGRVMVDFKEHDIPNTVENDCRHLAPHRPWAVTVHASGGKAMIEAARRGLGNVYTNVYTNVLAVMLLTSIDPDTCEEVYHRIPLSQVKSLAKIAIDAGADGFVCAPPEASHLRKLSKRHLLVTPGVRSPGAEVNDQKRVDTPANTRASGADYLVMGRQILNAPDPVVEVGRILRTELHIE